MNKLAHNLASVAEELYKEGFFRESKNLFFTAVKLAHEENPLMKVLEEFGFEPSNIYEYGDDDKLDSVHSSTTSVHKDEPEGSQEIWVVFNPEKKKLEYGYMYDSEDSHKHKYFDNLEDLLADVAEQEDESQDESDCGCGCGGNGNCKRASKKKNQGKKLNKPFRTPGGPKKFSVYVKNDKGNVVKVNFGDPKRSIKRDQPGRLKNFRARHRCDSDPRAKDKTTAKYWSCKFWQKNKPVSGLLKGKK